MAGNAQARFDSTLARIDSVLDQQVRRIEASEAHQAAQREADRAAKARDNMHERIAVGARYADAYRSFGSEPPMAVDDEPVARYRVRLYNRLARRLAPDHRLAEIRADDLSGQVLDRFEEMLLEAAKAEGERPSLQNLPSDGSMISRIRSDADTGEKSTEFFGLRSFIADMGLPGRKVLRICNPKTGDVLLGKPFDRAR